MTMPTTNDPQILITGATGFLGEALVRRLRREGVRVRALVRGRSESLSTADHVEIVRGDLRDAEAVQRAVKGVHTVYHLGAAMSGSLLDFEESIVRGTQNVVEACLANNVRRLVHVSSLGVVDAGAAGRAKPVHESSPLDPQPEKRGAYTYTKALAEGIIREAVSSRGLHAVIVRPGQIVGPRGAHRCPNATFSVGYTWVAVGAASQQLPLVFVDDVADALVLAGTRQGIDGQTFHVIDPENVTLGEYLKWYEGMPGRAYRSVRVPTSVMTSLATAMDAVGFVLRRSMPLSRHRVRALRPLVPFDVSAATKVLGWTPNVGMRSGLLRTFGERRRSTAPSVAMERRAAAAR